MHYIGAVGQETLKPSTGRVASAWQLSTRIAIPLLREVLVVAAVITSIRAMRVFDLVYTLTGGGPFHSSETVVTYIYQLGLGGART